MPSKSEVRIASLDGIRGFFTLAVIFAHSVYFGGLGGLFWFNRSHDDLSGFDLGVANFLWPLRDAILPGMDVFFVLSSFLITGILLDAKGSGKYFSKFYLRRTLRIFPLYYVALAILIAATLLFSPENPITRHQIWFWSYLSNVLFAHGWETVPEQFHHYWSLAVEEQFYLLWPTVVFFLSRERLKAVAIYMLFIGLAARLVLYGHGDDVAAYVATPARFDQLGLGALIALQLREPEALERWTRRAKPVLAGSFALIIAMALWRGGLSEPDLVNGTIGHTIYTFFAGSLLCVAMDPSSPLRRFFSRPSLRYCGKYSYALYICHQPVLLLLSSVWGLNMWRLTTFPGFILVGQLGTSLLALGVTFGLALLSWRFIEEPCLRLRSKLPTGS